MQITDLLPRWAVFESMARELGVPSRRWRTGAEALMPPSSADSRSRRRHSPRAWTGSGGLLGQLGGGGLLDQVLAPQPDRRQPGQRRARPDLRFQGHQPHRRAERGRAVRARPELLKKMLPLLAMLVAGFMSKQQGDSPMAPSSMSAVHRCRRTAGSVT